MALWWMMLLKCNCINQFLDQNQNWQTTEKDSFVIYEILIGYEILQNIFTTSDNVSVMKIFCQPFIWLEFM